MELLQVIILKAGEDMAMSTNGSKHILCYSSLLCIAQLCLSFHKYVCLICLTGFPIPNTVTRQFGYSMWICTDSSTAVCAGYKNNNLYCIVHFKTVTKCFTQSE